MLTGRPRGRLRRAARVVETTLEHAIAKVALHLWSHDARYAVCDIVLRAERGGDDAHARSEVWIQAQRGLDGRAVPSQGLNRNHAISSVRKHQRVVAYVGANVEKHAAGPGQPNVPSHARKAIQKVVWTTDLPHAVPRNHVADPVVALVHRDAAWADAIPIGEIDVCDAQPVRNAGHCGRVSAIQTSREASFSGSYELNRRYDA